MRVVKRTFEQRGAARAAPPDGNSGWVMTQLGQILVLTALAGAAIPLGGCLATVERIYPNWLENEFRHAVIAFGGGALVSAVALVLVPEGIKELPLPWVLFSFISGGLAFWFLDTQIARSQNSLAQLVAMLADFIPEALALGATFASEGGSGMLLALLIAFQNWGICY